MVGFGDVEALKPLAPKRSWNLLIWKRDWMEERRVVFGDT